MLWGQESNTDIWMLRTQARSLVLWYWMEADYMTISLNKNEINSVRLNVNPEHRGTPGSFTASEEWYHYFFFLSFSFITPLAASTIKYSFKSFCFNSSYNSKGLEKIWFCFLKVPPSVVSSLSLSTAMK